MTRFVTIPIVALAVATGGASLAKDKDAPEAVANLESRSDSKAVGTASFSMKNGKVHMKVEMTGLTPGPHAIHLHDKGDCSAPDAASAGGHWNPTEQPHGKSDAPRHHAGDLPSLRADASGTVKFSVEASAFRVGSGPNDVIGKGLIVHRDPDDYSQPSGNSGPRLACAVIVRS